MQTTSCEMLGWMNHKLESRLLGEIPTTLDDTVLMTASEEELKSLLMRVKQESGKVGLSLNIQKINLVASSCTTSRHIGGGKVEAVTDFLGLRNHCGQ